MDSLWFFSPGILRSEGVIDNDASIARLADISVAYAKAG